MHIGDICLVLERRNNMKKWQKFEKDCYDYLNMKYGNEATFVYEGGSNSNISDIHATTKDGKDFYIEAKKCPAQCGQFVLTPNKENKEFIFSENNATVNNKYSEKIINHMNAFYEQYANAGKKGEKISFNGSEDIFINWIKDMYRQKNVKYFITNNFKIVPMEKLSDYFTVEAVYRAKKSGSSNPSKKNINGLIEYLHNNKFNITDIKMDGKKLYVYSTECLDGLKFLFLENEYMFRLNDNKIEIRKLSNTCNSNVIFKLKKKK